VAMTAALTVSPNGAQDLPTVSFGTTTPVNITGTSAGTATLTITTTAPTSSTLVYPVAPVFFDTLSEVRHWLASCSFAYLRDVEAGDGCWECWYCWQRLPTASSHAVVEEAAVVEAGVVV